MSIAEDTILTIYEDLLLPVKRPDNKINIAIDILFTSLGTNYKKELLELYWMEWVMPV